MRIYQLQRRGIFIHMFVNKVTNKLDKVLFNLKDFFN